MAENKVQLEVFEGPLDLLLYLVKKEEVDIYRVNLTKIATQFVEYVDVMRELDLDIAGEFLVMAATLMYIKSRELLPVDQQALVEEEEETGDPRWELIRQLVEYKKFKDAAVELQLRETEQESVYPRTAPLDFLPAQPSAPQREEVSVFDLINAVSSILKRFNERDPGRDVFEDKWTVSEKIEYLRHVVQERGAILFGELFADTTSRTEVVVTFLALLELIRLKVFRVHQQEAFSRIEIQMASIIIPMPVSTEPAHPAPPQDPGGASAPSQGPAGSA